MKNTFGKNLSLTVFGESHGNSIGAVIDGLAPGIFVNHDHIKRALERRKSSAQISTPRREADEYVIQSGVFNGKTTGEPICITIKNQDTHSKDYEKSYGAARPGHADYTAFIKYNGNEDYRGGGHFSGRLTAAIVAAGALVQDALISKGIYISTHIKKCSDIYDREYSDYISDSLYLNSADFPVLNDEIKEDIINKITSAKKDGDSIGAVMESVIFGLPAGCGEPMFYSAESAYSSALFSIPGIKGVEFGAGFSISDMFGSQANDPFQIKDGIVTTATNNNGGINGGITNGMPVVIKFAVKPTPSISKEQMTVDFINNKNTSLKIAGRHDPAIFHRAAPVADAMLALCTADLLTIRYGENYLSPDFRQN